MSVVWRDIKTRLRDRLADRIFDTWIEPIRCEGQSNGVLLLECPNKFFVNWIRDKYLSLFQQELANASLDTLNIKLEVAKVERQPPAPISRQLILPAMNDSFPSRRLNSFFTFDRFVTGHCNEFAHSAAKCVSRGGKSVPNFLYFLAKTGLGKSHLSQAISAEVQASSPGHRVQYLTAEDFINQMVFAIKQKRMDDFKRRYRQECDLLVLEEVHFLAGKERTQDELASTLDALVSDDKRVVFTSYKLPRDIRRMDNGLKSRLNSGLIITIDAPEYETRVKILKRKAENLKLKLSDDVIECIAHHIKDDVRLIESCMISLAAKSSIGNRPLNLDLAQEVVKSFVDHRERLDPDSIQKFVADSFGISKDEIVSATRKQSVAFPRSIAIHFCRKYTELTLEKIGEAFCRNHATVIYTLKGLKTKIEKDRKVRSQIELLEKKMGAMCLSEEMRKRLH